MGVLRFIARRVAMLGATLLVASFAIYGALYLAPGSPIAALTGGRTVPPEVLAQLEARYHLNEPFLTRYWLWLTSALHGDLGESIVTHRPVSDDLRQYFPATLELSTTALVLSVALGLPLGVLAAVRRNRLIDHFIRFVSLIGVSVPVFWLGLLGSIVLWYHLNLLPAPSGQLDRDITPPPTRSGLLLIDCLLSGDGHAFLNALWHLLLPALVLGAYTLGIITRMTRGSMLEVLGQDYMRTARAKGLSGFRIVVLHGLRNALLPTITLAGLAYGSLLSGAVLTETVFSWPGIGLYATQTAGEADFPAIMGVALLTAFLYVMINLVIDVLYVVLNPQVRLG